MTEPVVTPATVAVAAEMAYCFGVLRTWEPLGGGRFRCECCGRVRLMVMVGDPYGDGTHG